MEHFEPRMADGFWILDGPYIAHVPFTGTICSDILRLLTRDAGKPVTRKDIFEEVWHIRSRSSLKDDVNRNHKITTQVAHLKALLGNALVTRWGGGYELPQGGRTKDELMNALQRALSSRGETIRVFPNPYKLHETGHPLSRMDAGPNDDIERGPRSYAPAIGSGHMIPYDDCEWALRIAFRHKKTELPVDQDMAQSWWYATIGVAGSGERDWRSVDLTGYRWLRFDARVEIPEGEPTRKIPLRIRLKDDDTSSDAPLDGHQSTSFSKPILLRKSYPERSSYEINLDALNWMRRGWSLENTGPVNRRGITQIVIGHDYRDEPMEGTIYLRNIRFEKA